MSEWIDFTIATPRNGDVVIVKGRPTLCCELDMEDEGEFECTFERKPDTWKIGQYNEIIDLEMGETFYVNEDEPRQHMQIIIGWKPLPNEVPILS